MTTLLLVDDNPNLLTGLVRQLRRHTAWLTVVTAPGAREALALLSETPFDLVVTDVLMPEMDGLELLRAIRKEQPLVKVIAMSGGGRMVGAEILGYAEMLGAASVLVKPFEIEQLLEAVRDLFPDAESSAPQG